MSLHEAIIKFEEYYKLQVKVETIRGYGLSLRLLCVHLKNPQIEKVKDDDINSYFSGLLECGWNKNSLLSKSIAFRKFFEYWTRKGMPVLNFNLIPVVKREFTMPHVAEKEDYDKIMGYFSADATYHHLVRNRAITSLLYDTGARVGEIISLNLQDMDLTNMRAVLKTEKSKGRAPVRQIFWTHETNENLKKWIGVRDQINQSTDFQDPEALFVGVRCWQIGQRLTIRAVGIFLRHASRKVKLKRIMNAHSLRHLKGNDMAALNTNEFVLSQILGHSQVSSSRIYTLLKSSALEKAARNVNSNRDRLNLAQ